jgi:hypothetical protein
MKTEPLAPADTRMMGIVHGALRRDLTRAAVALSRQPFPGDAQRVARLGMRRGNRRKRIAQRYMD